MGNEMSYDSRTEKGHPEPRNSKSRGGISCQTRRTLQARAMALLRTIVIVERLRHLWNKTTNSCAVLPKLFTSRC